MDESHYKNPEYLLMDSSVKAYADMMQLLDQHGFANTVGADIFLLVVDLHSIVADFVETHERFHATSDFNDLNQRKAAAERFRQHALHGDAIAPRFARLVDFMSEMIER